MLRQQGLKLLCHLSHMYSGNLISGGKGGKEEKKNQTKNFRSNIDMHTFFIIFSLIRPHSLFLSTLNACIESSGHRRAAYAFRGVGTGSVLKEGTRVSPARG